MPPASTSQPIHTPTVVAISGSATYKICTLTPGDILSDLWLNLRNSAEIVALKDQISIKLVSDSKTIIDTIVVPGTAQSVDATNNLFSFNAMFPVLYRAGMNGREISVIVTTGTGTVIGSISLGVRRNFQPYDNWQSPKPVGSS